MELMDRELQLRVLRKLADEYPEQVQPEQMGLNSADRRWTFNAQYLAEHGLIEADGTTMLSEGYRIHLARITAAGLDFLAEDGGLTAILGVVNVRLHEDTVRALIEARVDASELPEADKLTVKTWLRQAGSEALGEATKRLVGLALDQLPAALRLLQTLPG